MMMCRNTSKEVYISPTRLCLALTGAQSAQAHKDISDGFIIVESNYRVRLGLCFSYFCYEGNGKYGISILTREKDSLACTSIPMRYMIAI